MDNNQVQQQPTNATELALMPHSHRFSSDEARRQLSLVAAAELQGVPGALMPVALDNLNRDPRFSHLFAPPPTPPTGGELAIARYQARKAHEAANPDPNRKEGIGWGPNTLGDVHQQNQLMNDLRAGRTGQRL